MDAFSIETTGQERRADMSRALDDVITNRRARADQIRQSRWQGVSSSQSLALVQEALRADVEQSLGWPLGDAQERAGLAAATRGRMQRDAWGDYQAIEITHPSGLRGGGFLFTPINSHERPVPLVVACHGGLGSPELASGLLSKGSANYLNMIKDLRRAGVAVFAPQLFVWHSGQQPTIDQLAIDRDLRQLGGSRAAVDLLLIRAAVDALLNDSPFLDPNRLGIVGLSYGGLYALFSAALDVRYKAVVCSCYVNDRYRYDWEDWVWFDAANRFLDDDIARLVCPRALWLEAGLNDNLFAAASFTPVADCVGQFYRDMNVGHRFVSRVHDAGHDYDPDSRASEYLISRLNT